MRNQNKGNLKTKVNKVSETLVKHFLDFTWLISVSALQPLIDDSTDADEADLFVLV